MHFRNSLCLFMCMGKEHTSRWCAFWSSVSVYGTQSSSFFTLPKMVRCLETVEKCRRSTSMQPPVQFSVDQLQQSPAVQQDLSSGLWPWGSFWRLVSPDQNFVNKHHKVVLPAVPSPKLVLIFLAALDAKCFSLNSQRNITWIWLGSMAHFIICTTTIMGTRFKSSIVISQVLCLYSWALPLCPDSVPYLELILVWHSHMDHLRKKISLMTHVLFIDNSPTYMWCITCSHARQWQLTGMAQSATTLASAISTTKTSAF